MHPRRVVLIGFMASGKTEVGALLARRLGWRHVDLDREIEREAGRSVAEIFETMGERGFRTLEVQLGERFAALDQVVLSPGGGWITNPGVLAGLPPDTLTVWLRVSPDEVIRRLRRSAGQPVRPLLEGSDRESRVRDLLSVREPLYRLAHREIDTNDLSIGEVVDQLEQWIRHGVPGPAESDQTHQNEL